MNKLLCAFVLIGLSACAGTGVKRVVIDESKKEPSWVSDERLSWSEDGRVYFKSHQTVRGDQRLNGCYAIASHDNREMLIRQQTESMSGETNEAQTDISENAELILGKVRASAWSGKIYGFKDEGYFFQRVQIRDEMSKSVTERIDCYTLSSISQADYAKSRDEILHKIVAIDKKIKDAITHNEEEFFMKGETKTTAPAAEAPVQSEPVTQSTPEVKNQTAVQLPEEVKPAPVAQVTPPAQPVAAAPAVVEPTKEVAKAATKAATEKAPEAVKSLASAVQ